MGSDYEKNNFKQISLRKLIGNKNRLSLSEIREMNADWLDQIIFKKVSLNESEANQEP